MVVKVGINGFGRIGRVIFRNCFENADIELSAINDPAVDIEYICYLIKFDSSHGKFKGIVTYKDNELIINDKKIKVFRERFPPKIPWDTAGVQYVVEASGMFTCLEKASGHLVSEQVRRVIVTAPTMDIPMVILGVNDDQLKIEHRVLSCASSTLYCLAPIVKVLHDSFGVSEGFITSIHAMTPSLKPLDGLCLRGKHWRDHRSIHQNIIPACTGVCKALGKIMPEVKDKLNGLAFRVPVVGVSVLDITIRLKANTSINDIVKSVEKASLTDFKNIINISKENAVSSDFFGDNNSCVLDVDSSLELTPNFFKLICWYENEYSYACRVLDSICFSEKQISQTMRISNTLTPLQSKHVSTGPSLKCNQTSRQSKLSCPEMTVDDVKAKSAEKTVSLNLKHSLSPSSILDKNKYEIGKIWNDDCGTSKKNIKNKCSSFFQCCVVANPDPKAKRVKTTEYMVDIERGASNILKIADELIRKSYNKKTELPLYKTNKEKVCGQCKIESHNNKRTDHNVQINSTALQDCGDFMIDIRRKSNIDINIDKEKTKSNLNLAYQNENCKTNKDTNTALEATIKVKSKYIKIKNAINNDPNIEDVKTEPICNIEHSKHEQFLPQNRISTNDNKVLKEQKFPMCYELVKKRHETHFNELTKDVDLCTLNKIHKENVEQELRIIEYDFQPDSSIEKNTCATQTLRNKCTTTEDINKVYDLKDFTEYLKSKNYNINIIEEKFKKCNILLLDSDDSAIMPLIESQELPVEIESFCKATIKSQDVTGVNSPNSETTNLSQCDNVLNMLSLSSDDTRRRKQDIYDKLDSASATDSNYSFEVNEKKSQVINITDLTTSLEDLTRMDKICRIIEISDELSDELFSSLDDNDNPAVVKKEWSFKDLCERIQLDSFCNKVFGQTGI